MSAVNSERSLRSFDLSFKKYTVQGVLFQTQHSVKYAIFAADCLVDITMVKVMKQLTVGDQALSNRESTPT